MAISVDKALLESLYAFLGKKTVQDVNRETYLIHEITDNTYKIKLSFVFLKEWPYENDFDEVIINKKGVVFTFPSYWISVDRDLSNDYFLSIVNEFYNQCVSEWFAGVVQDQNNGLVNGNSSIGGGQMIPPSQPNSQNCPICGINI